MVFTWLIDDDYRSKAQLKYEVKKLEARLHRALCISPPTLRKYSQLTQYCEQLIHYYRELLVFYPTSLDTSKSPGTEKVSLDIETCYAGVLFDKKALHHSLTPLEEGKVLRQLYEAYQLFSTYLQASFMEKKNRKKSTCSPKRLSDTLKRYHPLLYHEEKTGSPNRALEQLFRLLKNTPIA